MRLDFLDLGHSHEIRDFSCSDEPTVADFLKHHAMTLHVNKYAITRLAFDEDDQLVGFFTLHTGHIYISNHHRVENGLELVDGHNYFPAINLHYFGVDSRFQGCGYGEEMIAEVFEICKDVSKSVGCTFIMCRALESAVGFYEKYGFISLTPNTNVYEDMIFKIDELD